MSRTKVLAGSPLRQPGALGALGLALLLPFLAASSALAAEGAVQVTLGGVKQVTYQGSILRLSVGNPEVAEISPLGTTDVLIKGRQIGSTSMMVWGREGGQSSYLIQVVPDADALAGGLKELFPGEQVTLQAAGETLVLKGTVSGLDALDAINSWAEGYRSSLGKEGARLRVINRLQLPSPQQVQLEVRFAEVSRSALRKLGMSLLGQNSGATYGLFGSSTSISSISTTAAPGTSMLPTPLAETMKLLYVSKPDAAFPFNAVLSVLSSRGLSKTLSEPTLVALSGQPASFLVGGEFPVPIPLGLNQVSIEYKKYGIQLDFTPTVLQDSTVQLKVATTVSDLDYSRTIQLESVAVPSLTSRISSTTVRLRSGQSFAVAGLLSDKTRSTVDKVPLLGDIPLVGMFFRSTQYQREETELVVVVTARLIQPLDAAELQPLVSDLDVEDPNDLELFIMGWGDLERTPERAGTRPARPSGKVGYRR